MIAAAPRSRAVIAGGALSVAVATAAFIAGTHVASSPAASASAASSASPMSSAGALAVAEPVADPQRPPTTPSYASDKPLLGVTAFVATVYKEPRDTAKKLGYLRVGTKVPRSAEPVGHAGCKGGWYQIEPRGFVCAGDDATVDLDAPLLKAAQKRPNLAAPLPYSYAFVRAVLPLYMRVPTAAEQLKAEFKLKEHLDWFKDNGAAASKVALGANDVAIDARGVAIPDKKLGELGLAKNSEELSLGALLGGEGDSDAMPFWLEGHKRAIPNVSDYRTKGFEVFADRARRHAGLSLVGSFLSSEDGFDRRFAITTDMRLAPASKIKPDEGSPFHGVELGRGLDAPLAFVRSQGATSYKIVKGKVVASDPVEYRSAVGLTGTMRTVEGVKYYRTTDKHWLSSQDVGLAVPPATWPDEAKQGKKWIEISITNQTLVMWEGQKAVYATLVSTGAAGLDDPKKTTATVRGVFHIRNKHVTATMDSNERSSVGGKADSKTASEPVARAEDDDKPTKHAKGKKADKAEKVASSKSTGGKGASKAKVDKADKEPSEHGKPVPRKGDGEYGVTKRRGEGTFLLRDVPWIQYFESGYALHAAYWHDVFGTPRSHGCVNLAPVDAHRLFFWTDPPMPDGWHGVNANEDNGEGTLVVIHE
ncbi:MAG TPA: L,D-transpeptidase [Byssovorax sp.]